MTTKEVYFKVYATTELPYAIFYYTFEDKNGVVQLFASRSILFGDGHEHNIEQLEKVEKTTEGFMFWNQSIEGESFLKENWSVIGKSLSNMILNQK